MTSVPMLSASRREGRGARPESDELRRLGAAHEGARPQGLAPRGWEGWVRRKTEPFPSLHPGQGGGLVWHTETRERRASGLFVMDTHLISPKRNSRGFLWSGFCRRGQTTSKNRGGTKRPARHFAFRLVPPPLPLSPHLRGAVRRGRCRARRPASASASAACPAASPGRPAGPPVGGGTSTCHGVGTLSLSPPQGNTFAGNLAWKNCLGTDIMKKRSCQGPASVPPASLPHETPRHLELLPVGGVQRFLEAPPTGGVGGGVVWGAWRHKLWENSSSNLSATSACYDTQAGSTLSTDRSREATAITTTAPSVGPSASS